MGGSMEDVRGVEEPVRRMDGLTPVDFAVIGNTSVAYSRVIAARLASGLSQSQFAVLLGVSVRTLQGWEQGRRQPTGAARALIAIAQINPQILADLAHDERFAVAA